MDELADPLRDVVTAEDPRRDPLEQVADLDNLLGYRKSRC
jgi:hypothetical protein